MASDNLSRRLYVDEGVHVDLVAQDVRDRVEQRRRGVLIVVLGRGVGLVYLLDVEVHVHEHVSRQAYYIELAVHGVEHAHEVGVVVIADDVYARYQEGIDPVAVARGAVRRLGGDAALLRLLGRVVVEAAPAPSPAPWPRRDSPRRPRRPAPPASGRSPAAFSASADAWPCAPRARLYRPTQSAGAAPPARGRRTSPGRSTRSIRSA